jgi:glycosyltransferase involved in cell wall biosynthesis
MARTFRESGAEVIYANTLQNFWAIVAANKAGLPAIWNVRESEPWQSYFDYLPAKLRPVAYQAFCHPYRVVFVAHATRRAWEALNSRHNFAVIHNGLDLKRARKGSSSCDRQMARADLGIGKSELAVVLLGTVCERKGQKDLVHAFCLLREDLRLRLRLFIVGDRQSEYSAQLHAEANALQPSLAPRIRIMPETDDPYFYLGLADIAVCCSRAESYPRVTLEAMAFGLPIISTPVFGIAEQLRENVNALYYQPDDAAQLAAHLARLATDDALRARLASNAFPVLESLPNFEDMLDGYTRAFQEARLSLTDAAIVSVRTGAM